MSNFHNRSSSDHFHTESELSKMYRVFLCALTLHSDKVNNGYAFDRYLSKEHSKCNTASLFRFRRLI